MHKSTLLLGLATIFSCYVQLSSANAAPAPSDVNTIFERSIEDIHVEPMTWIGSIEEGGENITIKGRPSEVAAKIKNLNPYWLRDSRHLEKLRRETRDRIVELEAAGGEYGIVANSTEREKRSNRVAYYCGQSQYMAAGCDHIGTSINEFINTYGTGWCSASPNACGRMACQWDSAILMCAGNNVATVPCSTLAQNMHFIFYTCSTLGGLYKRGDTCSVEGQAFYINPPYNVLIKHTDPGRDC